MDDNELDRLFGIDGGDDGSGADDPDHLQIVGAEDKTVPAEDKAKKDGGSKEKEPAAEDAGKEEPGPDKEAESSGKEEDNDSGKGDKDGQNETDGTDGKTAEEDKDKPSSDEPDKEPGKGSEKESDKEPSKEPEKESSETKKPKKKKNRKRLSGFGIGVIVVFVILVTLVMLLLFLPAFRVRSVTIEGNVELTDEQVLNEVGLKYNAHLMSGVSGNIIDILSLNYKTEEKIRNENPYISDITITIRIPSEVRITVKERRKICYVSTPDGYIALDRYGTVLELNSGKIKQSVNPIIYGITVESAKLGEKVVVRDENSYKNAIIVLGAILAADNATISDSFNMFEHTTEVRIIPSGYIFLTIYTASGKPVQVKLNKTDKINDKMAKLLYLFNSNAFDQVTIRGTLDMTGDEFIFNASSNK